jgi:FAD/FMN-containing dehydrogenase
VDGEVSRRAALKAAGVAGAAAAVAAMSPPSWVGVASALGRARVAAGALSGLTGQVVVPGDMAYDAARRGWDALFQSYPSVVNFVEDADDVVNAVTWARTHNTALRVRSGRHSLEGWSSVDGGIVIDVSAMKSIEVDRASRTAKVGTGVTQGELVAALGGTGLGFPTGSEASVGLGGVVLGGGIGVLSRRMGVACDNLIGVEMVVPSGRRGARRVKADETRNADLLWACRGGGGGNFGVATSYTLRLHPLPDEVVIWQVSWPFEQLRTAFDAWQGWAPGADERLGSTLVVLSPANGISADGVFVGSLAELGDRLGPIADTPEATVKTTATSWPEHYAQSNSGPRQFQYWKFTPGWARSPLSADALSTVESLMADAPPGPSNFWCLSWGGQVRNAPAGGSAFFHRDPLYYAEPGAGWNDPALTERCVTWIGDFREAIAPYVDGGYVNVPDAAIADFGRSYYGSHYPRLRRVKRRWDPDEVFRFPQSITPA